MVAPVLALAQASTGTASTGSDSAVQSTGLQILQTLLTAFQNDSAGWITVTQKAALAIFGPLATIDCFLVGLELVRNSEDTVAGLTFKLSRMLLIWGVWIYCIQNVTTVMEMIPKGFDMLGAQASNISGGLNPSSVISAGINVAGKLMGAAGDLLSSADIGLALLVVITAFVVVLGYAILGFQMFAVLVHMYIWLAAVPIFLAGGGMKFTREWATKQFSAGMAVGVNIFVIYLIAGVMTTQSKSIENIFNGASISTAGPILVMLAIALLFVFLAFKAPSIANALMNGSLSVSGGEMLGAAAGATAAAVGAMALGAKAMTGAANAITEGLGKMGGGGGAAGGSLSEGHTSMAEAFSQRSAASSSAGSSSGSGGGSDGMAAEEASEALLGPLGSDMATAEQAAEWDADDETSSSGSKESAADQPSGNSNSSGQNGSPEGKASTAGQTSGIGTRTAAQGTPTNSSAAASTARSAKPASQGGGRSSAWQLTAPESDASDAAISGSEPDAGQRSQHEPKTAAHPLDQLNDKIQKTARKVQELIPESSHQGTMNINHHD
nr:P-type conjugative transfer protein TrbL [Burkholderia sp. L27(2015)]